MTRTGPIPPVVARALFSLTAATLVVLLLLPVLFRLSSHSVFDDAYMYYRYATNLIQGGQVSFNPGYEPAYGLTSVAFLAIVVPIRLLLSNPPLVLALASTLCGLLFIGLVLVLVARHLDIARPLRIPILLFILASLAYAMKTLSTHFVSGMDTTFVLLFLTIYLAQIKSWERSPTRKKAITAAVCGGFAYLVRPDLLLYTIVVPLMTALFRRDRGVRVQALFILAASLVMTIAQMVCAAFYFDSPVPLAFYAKSGPLYGEVFHYQYRRTPLEQLGKYGASTFLLLLPALLPVALRPRRWWRATTIVDRAVLVSTILYISYYTWLVLQIMPFSARFYYPTLPAFVLLAARGLGLLERPGHPRQPEEAEDGRAGRIREVAGIGALLLVVGWQGVVNARYAREMVPKQALFSFDLRRSYHEINETLWRCLDLFSELPDDLTIATTEVGYPAAMNPRKNVIDLSGLNETVIARWGFSQPQVLAGYSPDIVYMPHYHYVQFNEQLLGDQWFREAYELFDYRDIGARMSIALLRESKYFGRMREIIVRNCMPSGR